MTTPRLLSRLLAAALVFTACTTAEEGVDIGSPPSGAEIGPGPAARLFPPEVPVTSTFSFGLFGTPESLRLPGDGSSSADSGAGRFVPVDSAPGVPTTSPPGASAASTGPPEPRAGSTSVAADSTHKTAESTGDAAGSPGEPAESTGRTAESTRDGAESTGAGAESTGDVAGPAGETRTSAGPPELAWERDDARPLSQPVVVGDLIAVYVVIRNSIRLQVSDPATGKVIWRRAASPGAAPPGVAIQPQVLDDQLIFLHPSPDEFQLGQLAVADARTGVVTALSEHWYWAVDRPEDCDGEVCVEARHRYSCPDRACEDEWSGDRPYSVRWDPATGEVREDPGNEGTFVNQRIGVSGLVSQISDDDTERLVRLDEAGHQRWGRPMADYFGPGYGSRYGWSWDLVDNEVFVGGVGSIDRFGLESGGVPQLRQVGIDAAGGGRLWSAEGIEQWFCAGTDVPGELDGEPLFVRCRLSSGTTLAASDDGVRFGRDPKMWLERFDPKTGEAIWAVPMPVTEGDSYLTSVRSVRLGAEGRLVVGNPGGSFVVDLHTGEVSPADAGTVTYCVESDLVELSSSPEKDGRAIIASNLWTTCSPDGTTSVDPMEPWPSWAGVQVGDIRVIATPTTIQGYHQPAN